jgi:hypothetical protein
MSDRTRWLELRIKKQKRFTSIIILPTMIYIRNVRYNIPIWKPRTFATLTPSVYYKVKIDITATYRLEWQTTREY